MGTAEDISQLKQEIEDALKLIGLNHSQFSSRFFDDTSHSENESERTTFMNTFNRQLSREGKTKTILNQLKSYLKFMYDLPEYKKAGLIPPRNVPYPEVDDDFRRGMARISTKIDDALEEKALAAEEENSDE